MCTNLCKAEHGWVTQRDGSLGTHARESCHGNLTGGESRSSIHVERGKPRSRELAYPVPTLGCRADRQPERKQKRKNRSGGRKQRGAGVQVTFLQLLLRIPEKPARESWKSQEKTCRSHLPDTPTAGHPGPGLIPRHPIVRATLPGQQGVDRTRGSVPPSPHSDKCLHLPMDLRKCLPSFWTALRVTLPSIKEAAVAREGGDPRSLSGHTTALSRLQLPGQSQGPELSSCRHKKHTHRDQGMRGPGRPASLR